MELSLSIALIVLIAFVISFSATFGFCVVLRACKRSIRDAQIRKSLNQQDAE